MTNQIILTRSLLLSCGVTLGVLGQAALAQQSGDGSAAQAIQRVEITGSSIRRVDSETPSPVQVISADDLKKSGYTSLAQVLSNITANGQGTLSSGFSGAFAAGAQGISLRGLNTAATLVLIDGHRMAPNALSDDGQRSFVDISNIPFDSVERVEILKDGASAIYGSDAMAGVVNVILKKQFTGTTVNAEGGSSQQGGGTTAHFSLTHGMGDLGEDGYNAFASIEYRHQDEITDASRAGDSPNGGWSTTNFTPQGGLNWTPGAANPYVPQPLIPGSVYLTNATPGAPFSSSNTVFLNGSCNYNALTASGCTYPVPGAILPESANLNIVTSFTKRLDDGWQLALKASYFDSKVDVAPGLHPAFPQSFVPLLSVGNGIAPHLVGAPIAAITVPASYPGNTLGVPAYVNGYDASGPAALNKVDSKNTRLAADLSGSIGDWDLQMALGYTRNAISQDLYGAMDIPAMNAALNRATNPYSLTGPNSAADLAAIYPNVTQQDTSTLSYAELHANRSLMELAGGDWGISTGASYIYRQMQSPAANLVQDGIVGGNLAFVAGSQSDLALFAETAAPLSKTFELDGAVRYDHFGDVGANNSFTPKAGFKWSPTTGFALRGTVATGFRAPNPAEAGQSGQVYVGSYSNYDPINCPGGAYGNASGSAPAKGSLVAACGAPAVFNTSNPDLQPEKSRSGTLGLILEPIKGWSSTFDLYEIKISDQIIAPSDLNINAPGAVYRDPYPYTGQCADGNGGTYTCTIPGGTNGFVVYMNNMYQNANTTETSGVELESHYKFRFGEYGSLYAGIDWSHTMSYILDVPGASYQLAGTHGPSIVGGNTGNPKDRIQGTLTYTLGSWDATSTLNYIGPYSVTDPSYQGGYNCELALGAVQGYPFFPGGQNVPSNYCEVGSFLTTDLTVRFKASKQLTWHFAVNNLFDRQPPVDLSTYGGGNFPYNPSMHMSGAIGRFFQGGVTYSF